MFVLLLAVGFRLLLVGNDPGYGFNLPPPQTNRGLFGGMGFLFVIVFSVFHIALRTKVQFIKM